MIGPKLGGVLEREPYNGDVHKIVNWVHNADKLTSSDPYYKGLEVAIRWNSNDSVSRHA